MTELLKQVKKQIKKIKNKIDSSLIYRLSKSNMKNIKLQKEIDKNNQINLIREQKYIDELNIKKNEIRYIDLQMNRVVKYINSNSYLNNTNEVNKEYLNDLIKGNKLE